MGVSHIVARINSPKAILEARMLSYHYSNVLGRYELESATAMSEVLSAFDNQHQDWEPGYRAIVMYERYERQAELWAGVTLWPPRQR